MSDFRVTDDSDSDSDFPPESGFSQAPRRLVIDDSNSSDESGYTTAREEEEDLDIAMDGLALTSPDVAGKNPTKDFLTDSPSTMSIIEKLKAGGVPHVVCMKRDSGISSLEHENYIHDNTNGDDDKSLADTPKSFAGEIKSMQSVHEDCLEEEDDTSTVVQEGRTKTPKSKRFVLTQGDDDDDDDDDDHLKTFVDVSMKRDDATTLLHNCECDSPQVAETCAEYKSEALVESSSDDGTKNVLQDDILTPTNDPSLSYASEALVDSSPDDTYNSEALVGGSRDEMSTVQRVNTPKRESSPGHNSEALVGSSPDDSSTSQGYNSEVLVDNSTDDTSTVIQVKALQQDPPFGSQSEAFVDHSPLDNGTVEQGGQNQTASESQSPADSSIPEALVGRSAVEEDDASTVYPPETPIHGSYLCFESETPTDDAIRATDIHLDNDTDAVTTTGTPRREYSFDNNSEALLDGSRIEQEDDASSVDQEGRTQTPMVQPTMNRNSEVLLESSIDDDDTSTLYPADSPRRESYSEPADDTSSVEQENNVSVHDTSDALIDHLAEELGKTNIAEELPIRMPRHEFPTALPGASHEQDTTDDRCRANQCMSLSSCDSSMDGNLQSNLVSSRQQDDGEPSASLKPVKTPKHEESSLSSASAALLDSSRDDASAVIQEGRIKTPKRKIVIESRPETDNISPVSEISLEHKDSSPVDPLHQISASNREASWANDADELVDTSSEEEDDASTVVQEGRMKTPKRLLLMDHDSGSPSESDEELTDSKHDRVIFEDEYNDSAWELDVDTNEVFLSDEKLEAPGDLPWPTLRLPIELYKRLYLHQKVGVQWMAGLHSIRIGGILGDDMGMGKTYQTLTLLGGLMRAKTIRNALIVAPLSILQSWEKEACVVIKRSCVPRITIIVLSSDMTKTRRQKFLRQAMICSSKSPYLIITTYGLVQSSTVDFLSDDRGRCAWDYVVLDEGHKVKNPSAQVSKACERICRNVQTRRVALTGTLIQNNLKELWAVVNWATSGQVFGTLPRFTTQYARPIEEGRHKNASSSTIQVAEAANNDLQLRLRPHYLQRMKSVCISNLPTKKELVVWTHLSPKQRKMYETYVKGDRVAEVITGEVKSPLEAITWLKKLCGHPLLVEITGAEQYDRAQYVDSRDSSDLIRESAKLQVLISLLDRLCKSGHRTLIFSQSTRMLDILDRVLTGFRLSRIDGSTKGKVRQQLVEEFNDESTGVHVMLLSTKAAGLGLTLTGSDRVIVYDPSWNPAEDAQAIDRAYRIGQQKEVTVYRFVAAGTVEEKMYEKQVHKDGIRRAVTTKIGNATERFFEKKDLRRLFELAPIGTCEVLEKIQADHRDALGGSGKPAFLLSHASVVGVSSHDDIYLSSESKDVDGDEADTPFGGTTPASSIKSPPLLGRSQRVLSKRRIDFSAASGTKENRGANIARPKSTSGDVKATGSTIESAIDIDSTDGSEAGLSESEIETLLDTAERLKEQGKDVGAMSILLDLAKKESVKGKQKLRMHQGLAELGRSLGWLYNDDSSVAKSTTS